MPDGSYLIAEYSTVVGTAPEKGVSELKKSKKDTILFFYHSLAWVIELYKLWDQR